MYGTLLNAGAIFLGAAIGLVARREMSPRRQVLLKIAIGVALVWFGLKIAFGTLISGNATYFGKLFLILLVAMVMGRLLGRLCRIQAGMNRVGQFAKQKLESKKPSDGLLAAALLFAAAPLGVVGAIEDGLAGRYEPLLIKGLIDGLGAFSFARMFGWPVLLSSVPVGGLLLAIAWGARMMEPWLAAHQLLDPIHVVAGFLILYVALIVFEIKKVELGDYLPALLVAPALAWIFR